MFWYRFISQIPETGFWLLKLAFIIYVFSINTLVYQVEMKFSSNKFNAQEYRKLVFGLNTSFKNWLLDL